MIRLNACRAVMKFLTEHITAVDVIDDTSDACK